LGRNQIFIILMSSKLKYRILVLMQDNKINPMELATKCQVHVQSVYNWSKIDQNNVYSIPADKLRIMANVFSVSMEEMYTDQESITA
jgi:hypothetical protein